MYVQIAIKIYVQPSPTLLAFQAFNISTRFTDNATNNPI